MVSHFKAPIPLKLMHELQAVAPILDAMPEVVHVYDSDWRWVYINSAAARWLRSIGKNPDALIGRRVWDEFHPSAHEETYRAAVRAVRENREVTHEMRREGREFETRIIPHSAGVISLTREVTEQRRQDRRRSFLAEAGALFTENRPLDETLHAVARVAVSSIADYAIAYVLDPEGRLNRVAAAHADPERLPLLKELDRVAPLHESDSALTGLLARAEPLLFESFPIERFARGPEHERLLRALGTCSAIIVPVWVQGRLVGGFSAATVEDGKPPFQHEDAAAVGEVARRAGLAMAIVQAHAAEQEARRTAEQAADAGRRLSAIVESSDDAIIGMDLDGVITSWNRAAERMYGYSAEEAVGRPVSILVPPDIADDVSEILARLHRGERVEHYETVRVARDGRRLDVSLTVSPIRDETGRVVGASKIARDVTERRRAEAELAAQRAWLAAVLDQVPVGIVVAHAPSGEIVLTNRAIEHILGGPVHRAAHTDEYGLRVRARHPDGRIVESGEWPLARALAGEEVSGEELQVEREDGRIAWLRLSAAPVRREDGEPLGAVAVIADITEERQTADDLRAAKEAAQEDAAKLEQLAHENERLYREASGAVAARDDMLAFVSHDLRNSLVLIKWSVQRLLEGETTADGRTDLLQRIRAATEHMDRLIQDLLTVSELEVGQLALELEPVAPQELVGEVVRMVKGLAAEKGLRLEERVAEGTPAVRADRRRIREVLHNLLGNALKFTPNGGRIEVHAAAKGEVVRFAVSDTGEGIASEDLPRVFDRFWHAQRSGESGAGLGLAICKGIVESHGGRIWADSQPDVGSTFYFTLPIVESG